MKRTPWTLLAGLLLVTTMASAAEPPPGNWKVTFLDPREGKLQTWWIVKLEKADGKWTGSIAATADRLPPTTLEKLNVTGDKVGFVVNMKGQPPIAIDCTPSSDGKKMFGTLTVGRLFIPVQLEATTGTSLDEFDANKDIVNGPATDLRIFQAGLELLASAGEKKAKPEEVRGWADKVFKAAELYGPRWQREVAQRNAEVLLGQEGMTAIALEHARRAERLLEPTDRAGTQQKVLKLLAQVLKKGGKADEAKEVEARLEKIDITVKPEKFAGRKAESDRAVLVELFTGAECPPCVAADLAFDALTKTYKPAEVVLLQYHVHIPGPDPLTSPGSLARMRYYGDDVEGAPTIFFSGRPSAEGGGGIDEGPDKYKQYRGVIDPMLEKPASLKLKASATQKGTKIDITAEASGIEKPSEELRLRLALVEETVNYTGGNGMKVHHHVVRALPGGAEGLALKDKTGKQTASVDLEEVRKELKKYLDDYAKEGAFPNDQRPMDLKNLRVVAFVQNDKTREVLQTVQVEVQK